MMKNMKNILSFFSILCISVLTVCCIDESKYEYSVDYVISEVYNRFDIEFIKAYGKPSSDNDFGFYDIEPLNNNQTRSSSPNSNQWNEFVNVPEKVGEYESNYVYNVFKTNKSKSGENIMFTDYFVIQTWKGNDVLTDNNGTELCSGDHMDYLISGCDHVYNFNDTDNQSNNGMMLIQNGNTDIFGYHNSIDAKEHYEYIVLTIDVPGIGVGYYVGFDFYADGENPNQKVKRDCIYTDWIVKIVPATYKNSRRVMCEDLGTTDDFDFNDVVFDVAYINEYYPEVATYAVITLQAAGGVLPLYVQANEVHRQFEGGNFNGNYSMINTGIVKRNPVMFRKKVQSTNPNDIEVKVNGLLGIEYNIVTTTGRVPYKICVPIDVEWTEERQNISDKYPHFKEWINGSKKTFW